MNGRTYEILSLTLRYWFVFLTAFIFWQSALLTARDIARKEPVDGHKDTGNIPFVLVLFTMSAFGLLAFRDPADLDTRIVLIGVLVSAIILFQFYLVYYLFEGMDPGFILIVDTLAVFGFVMLQRLSPELALRQIEWFALGNLMMLLFMVVIPRIKDGRRFIIPMMILGVAMLFIVYFIGERVGGARRWLTIGQYTVQPSEFVKILFILILAFSLKERRSFKAQLPLFFFVGISILAVVLQKDLGSALHYLLLFLLIFFIGTNDYMVTLSAMAAGVVGSYISYRIFPHVRVRVQAWRNPWADMGGGGYQVAQSLIAIGSGGLLGFGLGLGEPYVIPAARTDFIFAAICEEFGVLIGGMVIAFFLLLLVKGMTKALKATQPIDMLLSAGASVSLAIQAFIIIGGVIKLIPLTGITLPFVSYGGSSMMVSLSIVGILQGVSVKNARAVSEEDALFIEFEGVEDE